MANCTNCKRKITCGCQKRTASNGVSVCTNCLAQYEASLKAALKNADSNIQSINKALK